MYNLWLSCNSVFKNSIFHKNFCNRGARNVKTATLLVISFADAWLGVRMIEIAIKRRLVVIQVRVKKRVLESELRQLSD